MGDLCRVWRGRVAHFQGAHRRWCFGGIGARECDLAHRLSGWRAFRVWKIRRSRIWHEVKTGGTETGRWRTLAGDRIASDVYLEETGVDAGWTRFDLRPQHHREYPELVHATARRRRTSAAHPFQ